MSKRIYLFDTTLRDGAQTPGVNFTARDKLEVLGMLQALGIDYVEGGYPGASLVDDEFFAQATSNDNTKLVSFGMTRRSGRSASNDPGLQAVLAAPPKSVSLVGKNSLRQAKVALGIDGDENCQIIFDSVKEAKAKQKELLFDAEHFFDGFKEDEAYALRCLTEAAKGGADWLVLCDTNGGTLPDEVGRIVTKVVAHFAQTYPNIKFGIHCHNDAECAVANALVAVEAGCTMVQGALNGLGERCGNTNLVSLIPTLVLKKGYQTNVTPERLVKLTAISHDFDRVLSNTPYHQAPYVGKSAFATKAGIHASALAKDASTYEHIAPQTVGNQRRILVGGHSGRANLLNVLSDHGVKVAKDDARLNDLYEEVMRRDTGGYNYDEAQASFIVLALKKLGLLGALFEPRDLEVVIKDKYNGVTQTMVMARLHYVSNGQEITEYETGNGPVNAIDNVLRKALLPMHPVLANVHMESYRPRVLNVAAETGAQMQVMMDFTDLKTGLEWTTVGVSSNIITASTQALFDSFSYRLFKVTA